MTFKDENRVMVELARELALLRTHNLKFRHSDAQTDLLLFAEGAITLVALEHFLRIVLGSEATDRDTLPNLLERATSKRLRLLTLPAADPGLAIKQLTNVRNTLQHGNYAQAARDSGCQTTEEYFKSGKFASEIEAVFRLLDDLMAQIDHTTGKRRAP